MCLCLDGGGRVHRGHFHAHANADLLRVGERVRLEWKKNKRHWSCFPSWNIFFKIPRKSHSSSLRQTGIGRRWAHRGPSRDTLNFDSQLLSIYTGKCTKFLPGHLATLQGLYIFMEQRNSPYSTTSSPLLSLVKLGKCLDIKKHLTYIRRLSPLAFCPVVSRLWIRARPPVLLLPLATGHWAPAAPGGPLAPTAVNGGYKRKREFCFSHCACFHKKVGFVYCSKCMNRDGTLNFKLESESLSLSKVDSCTFFLQNHTFLQVFCPFLYEFVDISYPHAWCIGRQSLGHSLCRKCSPPSSPQRPTPCICSGGRWNLGSQPPGFIYISQYPVLVS